MPFLYRTTPHHRRKCTSTQGREFCAQEFGEKIVPTWNCSQQGRWIISSYQITTFFLALWAPQVECKLFIQEKTRHLCGRHLQNFATQPKTSTWVTSITVRGQNVPLHFGVNLPNFYILRVWAWITFMFFRVDPVTTSILPVNVTT